MSTQVSVAMIVKNGEKTIRCALQSLQAFSDVVVYDNGSIDGTQEIAKEFSNVRLIEGEFIGFGDTKNRAASYALNDWVFILDADEVVEPELANALLNGVYDKHTVYRVTSVGFYKDQAIRYSGWTLKVRRFYNRTCTRFNSKWVHETLMDEGMQVADLPKGGIQHYSYQSISEFIIKADRYSSLYAEDHKGRKNATPLKAFFNAGYSFFRTYVLKRGFLDGYPGLVIAFSHMVTNFYKYMKLYEANREL